MRSIITFPILLVLPASAPAARIYSPTPVPAGGGSLSSSYNNGGNNMEKSPDLNAGSRAGSALPVTTHASLNQVFVTNPVGRKIFRLFKP